MTLGKWLMDMIGGEPAMEPIPVREITQQQLMAQRRQLAAKTLTPERQERLAQAFEAQAARQKIDRHLRDTAGRQNLTDSLRRMMGEK